MPNVRVAQVGQLAVNQPVFEVLCNSKRYVCFLNMSGLIEFTNGRFLKSLGVNSLVANRFVDLDNELRGLLGIPANMYTMGTRFTYVTLGTGFAFVSDYSPITGWVSFEPTNKIWLTLA